MTAAIFIRISLFRIQKKNKDDMIILKEKKTVSSIIEMMLAINNRDVYLFYHKDTNCFDRYPVSAIQLQNLHGNKQLPMKDDNNFRFLSYDEINHKDIMSFYVKECLDDKTIRKQLFNILRRINYTDSFIEKLRELDLYDDFEMTCSDIYYQLFFAWAKKNHAVYHMILSIAFLICYLAFMRSILEDLGADGLMQIYGLESSIVYKLWFGILFL